MITSKSKKDRFDIAIVMLNNWDTCSTQFYQPKMVFILLNSMLCLRKNINMIIIQTYITNPEAYY